MDNPLTDAALAIGIRVKRNELAPPGILEKVHRQNSLEGRKDIHIKGTKACFDNEKPGEAGAERREEFIQYRPG